MGSRGSFHISHSAIPLHFPIVNFKSALNVHSKSLSRKIYTGLALLNFLHTEANTVPRGGA